MVDVAERQILQLEGCINATFAEGSGDVRECMAKFKRLKDEAQGVLHSLLENPGSGDGSDRALNLYPGCSWAVVWLATSEARGDASSFVGYYRQ